MTAPPSPPLESALPAPVLSVRAVLIATAAGAVLLVWLMATLATLSVQRASEHLGDARNSYEQLAIINRLEAEFGRLLAKLGERNNALSRAPLLPTGFEAD